MCDSKMMTGVSTFPKTTTSVFDDGPIELSSSMNIALERATMACSCGEANAFEIPPNIVNLEEDEDKEHSPSVKKRSHSSINTNLDDPTFAVSTLNKKQCKNTEAARFDDIVKCAIQMLRLTLTPSIAKNYTTDFEPNIQTRKVFDRKSHEIIYVKHKDYNKLKGYALERSKRIYNDKSATPFPYKVFVEDINDYHTPSYPALPVQIKQNGSKEINDPFKRQKNGVIVTIISFGQQTQATPSLVAVDYNDKNLLMPRGYQALCKLAHVIPNNMLIQSGSLWWQRPPQPSSSKDKEENDESAEVRYILCEYLSSIQSDGTFSASVAASNGDVFPKTHCSNHSPQSCWIDLLRENKVLKHVLVPFRRCISTLHRMAVMPQCRPFLSLYRHEQCNEVKENINNSGNRPTSLQDLVLSMTCILQKLIRLQYSDVFEFAMEVRTIFTQAQNQYPETSVTYQHADIMLKAFDYIFGVWVVNINCNEEVDEEDKGLPWNVWFPPVALLDRRQRNTCKVKHKKSIESASESFNLKDMQRLKNDIESNSCSLTILKCKYCHNVIGNPDECPPSNISASSSQTCKCCKRCYGIRHILENTDDVRLMMDDIFPTGCFYRHHYIIRLPFLPTTSSMSLLSSSTQDLSKSFWRPIQWDTTSKINRIGWYECVYITRRDMITSKYRSPNGKLCDELPVVTSARQKFYTTVQSTNRFLSIRSSSIKTFSRYIKSYGIGIHYCKENYNYVPCDGYFGLIDTNVQMRIEGSFAHFWKDDRNGNETYFPINARIAVIKAEMEVGRHIPTPIDIERAMQFLTDNVFNILHEGRYFCFSYPSTRPIEAPLQLPSSTPLTTSPYAHGLIPSHLMTDVLVIWHFFHSHERFLGVLGINLKDTCHACIATIDEIYAPSLHQFQYDEMACCLTRVLLLDVKHFSQKHWNLICAQLPLNVLTWPEVAVRCILAKGLIEAKEYFDVVEVYINRQRTFDEGKNGDYSDKVINEVHSILYQNSDEWATEKKISVLTLLINKILRTKEYRSHLKQRQSEHEAETVELKGKYESIIKRTPPFTVQHIRYNNDVDKKKDKGNEMEYLYRQWLNKHAACHNKEANAAAHGDICCLCGLLMNHYGAPALKYFGISSDYLCSSREHSDPIVSLKVSLLRSTVCNCHESCARVLFASSHSTQSNKFDITARKEAVPITSVTSFSTISSSKDVLQSTFLGSDSENNGYYLLGEKIDNIFCKPVDDDESWGVYIGSKRCSQLFHTIYHRCHCLKNISTNEIMLCMNMLRSCDFIESSSSSLCLYNHPLYIKRHDRLQNEYNKIRLPHDTQHRFDIKNSEYIQSTTNHEVWKMEMQKTFMAKCVELRCTAYSLSLKCDKSDTSTSQLAKASANSRTRICLDLTQYKGDDFILRGQSKTQTVREIQAQTIAHQFILFQINGSTAHKTSSIKKNHRRSEPSLSSAFSLLNKSSDERILPLIQDSIENINMLPPLAWDFGFRPEKEENDSCKNKVQVMSCSSRNLHSTIEKMDLTQMPIVRYFYNTSEYDSFYTDLNCATDALNLEIEELSLRSDRERAASLLVSSSRLRRSPIIYHYENAVKFMCKYSDAARRRRDDERVYAERHGFATRSLILASALGYLDRSIYGFRFKIAAYIKKSGEAKATIISNESLEYVEIPTTIARSPSYKSSLLHINSCMMSNIQKDASSAIAKCCFAFYKTGVINNGLKKKIAADSVPSTTKYCKSPSIDPIITSVTISNCRFEKVKGELFNIFECLPLNEFSSGLYFVMNKWENKSSSLTNANGHECTLSSEAWISSLKVASSPLDLLICLRALVDGIPSYWYAKSFQRSNIINLIDFYKSSGALKLGISPVALLVYALDRSIGIHSEIYGPWQESKGDVLGADKFCGYRSLYKDTIRQRKSRRIAGTPNIVQRCLKSLLCSKIANHSGKCNSKNLRAAEKFTFPSKGNNHTDIYASTFRKT